MKRENIGSEDFPNWKFSVGRACLFVTPAFTRREAKEQGRYFARVDVLSLGLRETHTVWFRSLKVATAFARQYLTEGVDLNTWRHPLGAAGKAPETRGSGFVPFSSRATSRAFPAAPPQPLPAPARPASLRPKRQAPCQNPRVCPYGRA